MSLQKELTIEAGTWLNGTWLNGTWLNGTWLNGTWLNGTWLNITPPARAKSAFDQPTKLNAKSKLRARALSLGALNITIH